MNETPPAGPAGSRLAAALVRGALGLAGVSVLAYSVWAFGGRWFHQHGGEPALYLAIALVFLGLSGPVLHPLVAGPGRLRRFYQAFLPAFLAYALVWCAAWFALRSSAGEWLGSLGGTLVFALLASRSLGHLPGARRSAPMLFLTHSAGYFAGGLWLGWLAGRGGREAFPGVDPAGLGLVAKLGWGLFHGLGFGAGLGAVFHFAQPGPAPRSGPAPD